MERVLNQEEINAMVRAARDSADGAAQKQKDRSIKPCNLRDSGQLEDEQVRAINQLHETFARSLTESLGAYLSVQFEAKLVSVEQLTYGEFFERVPEVTYMAYLNGVPMDARAVMQIDISLVFPLIDILLGGTGQGSVATRDVTDIEANIMEEVAKIICQELSKAWGPLGIGLEFGGREAHSQMQRFVVSSEKTICMSFEVMVADTPGLINFSLPAGVSNPLLRKLAVQTSSGIRSNKRFDKQLGEKMLDCVFPAALEITTIELSIQDLLSLAPGDVCNLRVPLRKSASFLIADREVFEANAVRQGAQRAAQIDKRIQIPGEKN
jgi:flagellar motor switch protein FliM